MGASTTQVEVVHTQTYTHGTRVQAMCEPNDVFRVAGGFGAGGDPFQPMKA